MDSVDLDRLSNLYLLTYTNEKYTQLEVCYEEELSGILCRVYQSNNTLIVTFSPFNCEKMVDYLRIGSKLVWQQNMVEPIGWIFAGSKGRESLRVGKMNKFFHDVSHHFALKIQEKNFKFSNLIITGMSMGAALGQCFYYHFHPKKPMVSTKIYAFGSPRIGDVSLRNWFDSQKNLTIKNYALFKLIENVKKIDPVCLFPSCKYGEYVNNTNITMLYEGEAVPQAEYIIDQKDTEITPFSILCNCGLDKSTSHLWDVIHDTDEYYNAVCGI